MAKNHSENNGKKPLFWEWEFSILVKGVLNLLGNFHYFKNGKFPFIFNSEWKKSILKSYGGLPFNSVWVEMPKDPDVDPSDCLSNDNCYKLSLAVSKSHSLHPKILYTK